MSNYDFCGWATRNDVRCSDGRTIRRNAFKECDGKVVPLVYMHQHTDPFNVLGHALLENRKEGVYAYCSFNDTAKAQHSKELVKHGDIVALSIYANQLKESGGDVLHGNIREVSLVLAPANPEAFIESVMVHGEESDSEGIIYTGEPITINDEENDETSLVKHSDSEKEENKMSEKKETNETKETNEKTVQDVFDEFTEEQKNVVYAMIGMALEENDTDEDDDEEDNKNNKNGDEDEMKHNLFDNEDMTRQKGVLCHSDQETILNMAKNKAIGTLQNAIDVFAEENSELTHSFSDSDMTALFPDYKDVRPGEPEIVQRDQGWVTAVLQKVHKSPISRIRTRQVDARGEDLRGLGYKKGSKKKNTGNMKLIKRTTDPQTIYVKDALNRDDIVDITDFDVVSYLQRNMRQNLNEEVATAIMIGDGREEGDENKIFENHVRPIWTDDDLYTIHTDVDLEAARADLQGTNTGANFGENYIYAEAIITAALYSREQYKGTGTPDFYCTPHLLNIMLLARDLNGRRIYDSKTDLAAALNVNAIYPVEQFEGKTRTDDEAHTKKLLGIFVNLDDYHVGAAKGGEITTFNQFDIDFNQEKCLIETRISGALTRIYSAIVLEEPVEGPEAAG